MEVEHNVDEYESCPSWENNVIEICESTLYVYVRQFNMVHDIINSQI